MYVVKWNRTDGESGWHQAADVQAAMQHVEHLRNSEGVDNVKIFRLEEVAIEFRPYYKVELAAAPPASSFAVSITPDPMPAPPAPVLPADEVQAPSWPSVDVPLPEVSLAEVGAGEPLDVPSANGTGRRGLFGR